MMAEAIVDTDPPDQLPALLDAMFDDRLATPHVNQMVDQLIAASYFEPDVRNLVSKMYSTFGEIILTALNGAYPDSPELLRRSVAHGILALAHSSATFEWLAFDGDHYAHARQAAEVLLSQISTIGQ